MIRMSNTYLLIAILLFSLFVVPSAFASNKTHSLAFFVGHSQWKKGATGINKLSAEWDYCNVVANLLVKFSKHYGVKVKIFYRPKKKYPQAMTVMYKKKNRWNVNAPVISCHYNITPQKISNVQHHATKIQALFKNDKKPKKGTLVGALMLYKPDAKSKQLAEIFLENMRAKFPRNNSAYIDVSQIIPTTKDDRGSGMVLSPYSKSANVLFEIGYGDNDYDSKLMLKKGFKIELVKVILKTVLSIKQ